MPTSVSASHWFCGVPVLDSHQALETYSNTSASGVLADVGGGHSRNTVRPAPI